jgi:flagellin
MASVINTNMASLYAQKNLSGAQNALSTSVERLSSGLRINRAKDDAAGLGISEKIKSQVTSLNQGLRNANDAISMVQTAEGSLSEVSSILQRMKELSVQARNDSLSTTQRSFISDELVALKNEINAIAERTTFNDLSLLKNALRTQVAVPAAADATKLVNGASLLDGISVSNLALKNTNAGTYTVTTGTQTPITGQISEAAGKFGGAQVDTLTLSGTFANGDVITITSAITGGATVTATYTVNSASDLTVNGVSGGEAVAGNTATAYANIAKKVAAAFNVAAQAATGVPLAAQASGATVNIGGASDSVSITTTRSVTSTSGLVSAASTGVLNTGARAITVRSEDAVEGNKFILSIGSKDYSVVAGYGANAGTIRDAVATRLAAALSADYAGVAHTGGTGGIIDAAAAAGLGAADISLRVVRLADGKAVTNQASTVSAASTNSTTANRTITVNDFDIVAGRKATVKIGNPDFYTEFSTVIGSSDDKSTLATRLAAQINATHGGTAAASGVITITGSTAPLGMSNISLTFNEMTEGSKVTESSRVSAKYAARDPRTITINQSDLSPGNVVSVNIGKKEYAVKVESGELASNVAYRLSSLIDDDYPPVTGTVTNSTATFAASAQFTVATGAFSGAGNSVATFATGMSAGDSITIAGLTFTARRSITTEELAAAWSGLVANGTTGAGATYGDYSGSLNAIISTTAASSTTVTFSASGANATNVLGLINNQGQAATRAVSSGTTRSSNVITLGAGSNLGLEDISVSVKKITDPGKITITANADTGIGGTKQSIDVGTIAAGSAKSFDFDNLGVSFTLNNSRASAVNAASFEALTPKANTLSVQAAMDGNALFQVGAGTRDNVVLDGFKDIRMTGQNKNVGSEKEVFDKVNETLTTISANTTESLSEANFATLENRIEDAITMVSDFRSYFGGQQNRIEFAISNIQAQSENLTAANSRIVDTDYAAETANLTKTQIMQQAATAMLAQANQMPNVILALLK